MSNSSMATRTASGKAGTGPPSRIPRGFIPWIDFDTEGREVRKLAIRVPAWAVHALKARAPKTSKTRITQWGFETGMGPLAELPIVTELVGIYNRHEMTPHRAGLSDWNFTLSSMHGQDNRVYFDKVDPEAQRQCLEVAEALGLTPAVVGGMAVVMALVGLTLQAEYLDLLRGELKEMMKRLSERRIHYAATLKVAKRTVRRPSGSVQWEEIDD